MHRVADLLDHTGTTWDDMKLQAMFSEDDVNDIKQISVGRPGCQDYMAWNFTKDGVFTVKSAYHLRMSLNGAKL